MERKVLRAFYDLARAPVSFDVFTFLYLAEIERINRKLSALDLIIIANSGDGFRHDASPMPLETKHWRLRHILLSAGNLLPSCRRTLYCPTREDAHHYFDDTQPVFPAGYSVEEPTADYSDTAILLAMYSGQNLGTLRAPKSASDKISQWLQSHTGNRYPVVITLRNDRIHPLRNSNLEAWSQFASSLDQQRFCPIFVRDTADVFDAVTSNLSNFLMCDMAAIDIELRLALYEAAYLNLFVDSGPAALCMLDDATRCIRFKAIADYNPHAGLNHFQWRGYEPGMQWAHCTSFQKTVWEDDKFDVIRNEFERMTDLIESDLQPSRLPLPTASSTAARFIIGENYSASIALCERMLAEHPEDIEGRFLLATACQKEGLPEKAVKVFESIIAELGIVKSMILPYARALHQVGRTKDVLELLRRSTDQFSDDKDFLAAVGQELTEMGEEDEGIEILHRLCEASPDNSMLHDALARYYSIDNITIPRAIEHYQKALELNPGEPSWLFVLAHCFARLGNFSEAVNYLKEAMRQSENPSIKDIVMLGQFLLYAGDNAKAGHALTTALNAHDNALSKDQQVPETKINLLAARAHISVLLGRNSEAENTYRQIAESCPQQSYKYDPQRYLHDTPGRINALREIVAGRDVFLFCHGPSIAEMDTYWSGFSQHAACLFAVNRFRVFETGFLAPKDDKIDVVMKTHYRGIRPHIDQLDEFLKRPEKNMFLTSKWAMERLGSSCPARHELERKFDNKMLYFGGAGGSVPATPLDPLRFIYGNTLSLMIVFAAMSEARRVFLFGADGGVADRATAETHYGAQNSNFLFKFDEKNQSTIESALRADATMFNHITETGLIAAEHLYGVKRPPIYNVSPDSALTLFPRIDYATALQMVQEDAADLRRSA